MGKMYYEKNHVDSEIDRQDEERYFQKRNMPIEKKKKTIARITKEAIPASYKMVEASGVNVTGCPGVIRTCLGAMVYGMLCAMSIEELGYNEWRWTKSVMTGVANMVFAMDAEESVGLAEYLFQNSNREMNPELNKNVHLLIHYGIDLFYLLDQPERLTESV